MRWQGQLKRVAAGLLLLTGVVTVSVGAYMLYMAHTVANAERRVFVPLPTEEPGTPDPPSPVMPTPTPLTPYTPTPSHAPATTLADALTPLPTPEPLPLPTSLPATPVAPEPPALPAPPAPPPATLAPLPPTPPPPMPPTHPPTAPTHTPVPLPPPLPPTHTPVPLPPTHVPVPMAPKAPPPSATRAPNVVVIPLAPVSTGQAGPTVTALPTPIIIVLTTITPTPVAHTVVPGTALLTPSAHMPTSTPPTSPMPTTRTLAPAASPMATQSGPSPMLMPTPALTPMPKPTIAAALSPPPAPGPGTTGVLRSSLGAATGESNGHEPVWGGKQYVHILLLGLDRRDNEPTRSDTMILATVNLWDGVVSLLSIPRDLLVPIPDHGEDRVNTAFAYGEATHPNDPAAGPALAVKTVSRQFNVPIEHYLFVDFGGFREIVDAVGGVEIAVPVAIDDPQYPTDNSGVTHLHFDAGMQHMNGSRALAYARTRHSIGDDNERRERQMQVMQAVLVRALQIDSVRALPEIVKRLGNHMQTSLPYDAQLSLVKMGRKIGASGVAQYSIRPPLVRPFVTSAGADIYLPDWAAIRPIVLEAIEPKRKATQR